MPSFPLLQLCICEQIYKYNLLILFYSGLSVSNFRDGNIVLDNQLMGSCLEEANSHTSQLGLVLFNSLSRGWTPLNFSLLCWLVYWYPHRSALVFVGIFWGIVCVAFMSFVGDTISWEISTSETFFLPHFLWCSLTLIFGSFAVDISFGDEHTTICWSLHCDKLWL